MNQPVPFGRYLVLDCVSAGDRAEVWRALHASADGRKQVVVIKRLLPAAAQDDGMVDRFLVAAKINAQINHVNVVQLFELGNHSSSYFVSCEYVSGLSVRSIAAQGAPLPMPLACFVLLQCCAGLDFVHEARDQQGQPMRVVHRDVAPQHLLVSWDGEVKLTDFFLAKLPTHSATGAATCETPTGRVGYMSPEQLMGMASDRRADVFSLGVCLHESSPASGCSSVNHSPRCPCA